MKRFAVLVLGSAFFAPMTAMAGGLVAPVEEPVIIAQVTTVPDFDWTGFYGGAALGYGDVGSTGDVLNGSGFLGGILAGYRMDWGQWVGGVEADYDWSGIDLGDNDTNDGKVGPKGIPRTMEQQNQEYIDAERRATLRQLKPTWR